MSDNAATDGGGGGVRAQTTLAEASVGGGSVTGAASGGGRDAQGLYNDVMIELRLVDGAALRRSCCIMDGVVVFEAEERRFARAIQVGAGADATGGRTAEVLKVAASGAE